MRESLAWLNEHGHRLFCLVRIPGNRHRCAHLLQQSVIGMPVCELCADICSLCTGYAIYVPPFAFICQFAGPNVGTMSSLYAVSGAIGSMLYLAAYSTIVSSSAGWYGVWLLMTILSAISTAAMAGFTMMDLQGLFPRNPSLVCVWLVRTRGLFNTVVRPFCTW